MERAGREDAGTYECWDTKGEALSRTKQVPNYLIIITTERTKVKVATITVSTKEIDSKDKNPGPGPLPSASVGDKGLGCRRRGGGWANPSPCLQVCT